MAINNKQNTRIYTAALKYVKAGLEVIYEHPVKKNPETTNWQTKTFHIDELKDKILVHGWGVGIRNIEGLDFDNNGSPDAKTLLTDWTELVNNECPGLVNRLLIESTKNNGFHVVWKCNFIEGNQKLALRPLTEAEAKDQKDITKAQKTFTLIETRGKGGQFVVSPSLGYTIIQGDWCNLCEISVEERLILINCARVFDRLPKTDSLISEHHDAYIGNIRPGDIYNNSVEGQNDALELLLEAGWTHVETRGQVIYLRRPGKNIGVSATFGYVAPGILYNFSSNAYPFEPSKPYNPFVIYTYLKHNGNFFAAAKDLSSRPSISVLLSHNSETSNDALNLTDLGNATKFTDYFGEKVRFDHKRQRWLVWHTPRWESDKDGEIYRLAIDSTKRRFTEIANIDFKEKESREKAIRYVTGCQNKNKIDAMCGITKNLPPVADIGDRWDQNPMLLSCSNGVVDLNTGLLREGRPEDSITMSTGIRYDPNSQCPLWLKFLAEIFDGNNELIQYIQKALGYSVTGNMSEQVIFFCYGSGANGKSVLISVLQKILGDYAHNVPFSTFQKQGVRGNTNDLAGLDLRRWVVSSEALGGTRLDETVLKNISGGDPLSARFLHKEFSTFTPQCKIWFFVNHKPIVKDDSYGFWRRVRLIPFTRTFEKNEQDKQLALKLYAEAEGILKWLVNGALLWQKEGLSPLPKSIENATAEYQRDSDMLADFIYEKCLIHDNTSVKACELWKAFDTWQNDQGLSEKEMLGSKGFYLKISEKFNKVSTKQGKIYKGIGLDSTSCDGSLLNIEASDGSLPKNTNSLYSISHREETVNTGYKTSPFTGNDNEINNVVENNELLDADDT